MTDLVAHQLITTMEVKMKPTEGPQADLYILNAMMTETRQLMTVGVDSIKEPGQKICSTKAKEQFE